MIKNRVLFVNHIAHDFINSADYAHSSVFQPYPGTRLAELASEKGIFNAHSSILNKTDYLKGISHLNIRNKSQIRRLNKIFAVGVYLKLDRRAVCVLIMLPLLKAYEIIHFFFKVYCGKRLYRVNSQVLIMQFLYKAKFFLRKRTAKAQSE